MKRTFTRTLTLSLLLGMFATTTSCVSSGQKSYAQKEDSPLNVEKAADNTPQNPVTKKPISTGATAVKPVKTQSATAPAPRIRTFSNTYSDSKVKGAFNGISRSYWNMNNPVTLTEDLDGDGRKESITIHVNQYEEVLATKGGYGTNLLYDVDLSDSFGIYDEDGDMNEDCSIHVALYDFDKDGKLEVIVIVGCDIDNYVTIFRVRDAEEDSYKSLGTFNAQREIILRGEHIIAPYGSRGLYTEYLCDGHRIIELDNIVQ